MSATPTPTRRFFEAPASQGGLPGHGFECSCGSTQTTSMGEREAKMMAQKHREYHDHKGS
jgi:hypothetical protein